MKAVRWHARNDVRLDEVDVADVPPPGCSVVEVAYCGICGSDLAEYRDGPKLIRTDAHPLSGQAPPITLGHEFAGRVVAASDERAWPTGTRVTADVCLRCGKCDACLGGDYNLCRYGGSLGLHADGAFALRVVVPEYCLIALPDAVPDVHGALAEPLAVGLHALGRGGAGAGSRVLVLGFGPIGAATALVGRAIGCTVHVVERDADRQACAEALGFATLNAGDDLPRRVRRALGAGGADVVAETTGAHALLPAAIECARRGGSIALAGITSAPVELDTSRLVLFERSLVGSLGYCFEVERVVAMMAAGQLDPSGMISGTIPLSETVAAIRELAEGPGPRIKVMVDTRG